ncbi:MAG: hypothetical protein JHD16_17350, partial [Solirubrobacteraceae bacterium]|nr:hypothetical protein [Solirubrobacteraceae bacterium]
MTSPSGDRPGSSAFGPGAGPPASIADAVLAERPLSGKTIGVLALQGDVRSHAEVLMALGADVRRVRS